MMYSHTVQALTSTDNTSIDRLIDVLLIVLAVALAVVLAKKICACLPLVFGMLADTRKLGGNSLITTDLMGWNMLKGLKTDDQFRTITIVDVANLCAYFDKNKQPENKFVKKLKAIYEEPKVLPKHQPKKIYHQADYINSLLECIGIHYGNQPNDSTVIYVVKNMTTGGKSPRITDDLRQKLVKFVKTRDDALIALAEDYVEYDAKEWQDNKKHYLRGRDDYLCFLIADYYDRLQMKATVVTNDRFKDFKDFSKIPIFKATLITKDGSYADMIDPSKKNMRDLRRKIK